MTGVCFFSRYYLATMFSEAFSAVNGSFASGLEGNLCFLAAVSASDVKHFFGSKAAGAVGTMLGKALATINRPITGGLKRNLCFLATVSASDIKHGTIFVLVHY